MVSFSELVNHSCELFSSVVEEAVEFLTLFFVFFPFFREFVCSPGDEGVFLTFFFVFFTLFRELVNLFFELFFELFSSAVEVVEFLTLSFVFFMLFRELVCFPGDEGIVYRVAKPSVFWFIISVVA